MLLEGEGVWHKCPHQTPHPHPMRTKGTRQLLTSHPLGRCLKLLFTLIQDLLQFAVHFARTGAEQFCTAVNIL